MEIFISWSGERSRQAAEALRNWLPKVINAVKPWISSSDIDKGARWSTDVATRLETAKIGIICLTPSNLHEDWILFEAGALSKTLRNTFVCPVLIDLKQADVTGPLAQFQSTRANKEEILRLVKTINTALGEQALSENHLEEAFEVWWPRLEDQFKTLPPEKVTSSPQRSDRELLEEILEAVRNQNRLTQPTMEPIDVIQHINAVADEVGIKVKVGRVLRGQTSTIFELRTIGGGRFEYEFPDNISKDQLTNQLLGIFAKMANEQKAEPEQQVPAKPGKDSGSDMSWLKPQR